MPLRRQEIEGMCLEVYAVCGESQKVFRKRHLGKKEGSRCSRKRKQQVVYNTMKQLDTSKE